jgi:hypothetical protein
MPQRLTAEAVGAAVTFHPGLCGRHQTAEQARWQVRAETARSAVLQALLVQPEPLRVVVVEARYAL